MLMEISRKATVGVATCAAKGGIRAIYGKKRLTSDGYSG
jgi:hypothetical protein